MKRKIFTLLSMTAALSTVIAACSSNTSTNKEGAGASQPSQAAPVNISVMTNFFAQTPAAASTAFEKKLNELTNSNLKIQWVSANNYNDKLSVTLASGDLPDMLLIPDPFTTVFRGMATQGAFWDVTPFIKDYKNLSQYIDKVAWTATKMEDGKNYGIPRPRDVEGDTFFFVRKDWLDNLGLKEPKTSDELYQVMKAFTEQDPDKNGKNDTTGYAGYLNTDSMGGMSYFESMFTKSSGSGATGGTPDWALQKDGKLAYTALMPEERQALEYMAKAYKEKLFPEDLGTLKVSQARDLFQAGKAGILAEKDGTMAKYLTELRKTEPKAEVIALTDINAFNPKGSGFAGMYAIPKKVPEAKLKQILQTLDNGMKPEVTDLIRYGLEGVHYELKNGEKLKITEPYNRDAIGDYNQIFIGGSANGGSLEAGLPKDKFGDLANKFYKVRTDRHATEVPNYALGLYSETLLKINPELNKKNLDLKMKIILGGSPISAWDEHVAKLKADPNTTKMVDEMNASYQKRIAASK